MYVLGHVETSLTKSPFWVIAITLPLVDPVCTDFYILVNPFIRRPAHCCPAHCKLPCRACMNKWHWGKVGCACSLLPRFRQDSVWVTIRTLPEQHAQTGFNFHHFKLVFHFAGKYYFIRGKLKWEAYLIKIQSGTNITLSYSSLSNLSLAYFS